MMICSRTKLSGARCLVCDASKMHIIMGRKVMEEQDPRNFSILCLSRSCVGLEQKRFVGGGACLASCIQYLAHSVAFQLLILLI